MPSSSPTHLTRIPVIDVSALARNAAAAVHEVADDIRRVSVDVGFFYVTGHGVPRDRHAPSVAGEYIIGRCDDTHSHRKPARPT